MGSPRAWLLKVGALAIVVGIGCRWGLRYYAGRRRRQLEARLKSLDYLSLVGNTPLVYIRCLSKQTGCTILAKCEFLNPGGSSKDRIAKQIVVEAERSGQLVHGGTIVEGTSGSTGISLAQVAKARQYACVIVVPDDQAQEKYDILTALGARLELVKPCSIVNRAHYVNVARKLASEIPGGFFANQFENLANFRAHFLNTGPEIWKQTGGIVDAFVMSAGTGGTIAGVGAYLKSKKPNVRIFLADPQGSSLYHKVNSGVLYTEEQEERRLKRHRYDTITEGIGMDRQTANLGAGLDHIEEAFRVSDKEAVAMARFVLEEDGFFVGSSSAVNLHAAVKAAERLGPGNTSKLFLLLAWVTLLRLTKVSDVVVTVLCGSGHRELTKLHNPAFLQEHSLV